MPKVTPDQWKAQERRYLDAARRCFTRIGVAPASMEEIRTEAGASAGAMYRYFASKDDLVHAAIETSMREVEALLGTVSDRDDSTAPIAYLHLVLSTFRQFRYHTEGVDLFRLGIQGWAHAQSHPETRKMVMASFERQTAIFTRAAARWTARSNAAAAGRVIGGAVIGYVVQSTFSDKDIDPKHYCNGFSGLS